MTTNGRKKRRRTNIYRDPNQQWHVTVGYLQAFPRLPTEGGSNDDTQNNWANLLGLAQLIRYQAHATHFYPNQSIANIVQRIRS